MIRIFALGTFLFFLTTLIYVSKYREVKDDNSVLKYEKKRTDSLDMWRSERLLIYLEISLEQNNIIDTYQSTRMAKMRNKKLNDLQQKLN